MTVRGAPMSSTLSLGHCRLHLRPQPHLHRAALTVALRGGPRVEGPREEGLTHFLEHMLFRGAGPWRDARELLGACEELGEDPEAWTGDDALVVSLLVDPDRAGEALGLLGQLLSAPRYADLERERAVIMEERLERVDARGDPSDLDDLTRAAAFAGHPLARSIVGSLPALRRVQRAHLERWRRRLVQSGNLVVVAAGAFDPRALRAAAGAWRAVPAGPALPATPLGLPPARSAWSAQDGSAQVELRFCLPGPGVAHPRYPELVALADVLDGGPTARVPTALVDAGLCYHARADLTAFPELSLLELELAVEREKLPRAVKAALEVLASPGRGVTREELARAALRRAHRARGTKDDALELAEWTAHRLVWGLPADLERERARVDAVDPAGVSALARAVCRPERLVAVMLGAPGATQRRAARRALREWSPA